MSAPMKQFALIVTDSSPLITLGIANALDSLLALKLPVIVPDMVRFEVIRDLSKPGAQEVADWIRKNEGGLLRVASTEVFEEYQVLASAKPGIRTFGRGEQAAAEVLTKELAGKDHGAILLFEDSDVRKQNFLVRLPDEVLVISTSELLFRLESVSLVSDAAVVLARATPSRGDGILKRQLGGTATGSIEDWPARVRRPRP
jgi:hypothetical protein